MRFLSEHELEQIAEKNENVDLDQIRDVQSQKGRLGRSGGSMFNFDLKIPYATITSPTSRTKTFLP